ncbi:MAG: nitroreductase family protein [Candidatus Bathyarchaeota archaeon]|nr:MAG: nitroreductase family protein [Candidatus Bathyarchaeota archaeon]
MILQEIKDRRSPLVFKEDDVDKQKIKALIEAARWAPSCFNKQPWKYVFVHKNHSSRENLEAALALGNGWAKRAPYLVAVGANPNEACKTNGLPYYAYDIGLSVMTLVIEAEHQGLRVHQMAGWNEEKVKTALSFPENYRVVVVFALGYEGDAKSILERLEERVKERLAEPRKRNAPTKNFFFGAFKKP